MPSASTGGSAVSARSAEGPASVGTGGSAVGVRSVEVPASASTGGSVVSARSAEGAASVSTGDGATGARSVPVFILVALCQASWVGNVNAKAQSLLSKRRGTNTQSNTQMGLVQSSL